MADESISQEVSDVFGRSATPESTPLVATPDVSTAVAAAPPVAQVTEATKRGLAFVLCVSLMVVIVSLLFLVGYTLTLAPDSLSDVTAFVSTPLVIALTSLGAIGTLIGIRNQSPTNGSSSS